MDGPEPMVIVYTMSANRSRTYGCAALFYIVYYLFERLFDNLEAVNVPLATIGVKVVDRGGCFLRPLSRPTTKFEDRNAAPIPQSSIPSTPWAEPLTSQGCPCPPSNSIAANGDNAAVPAAVYIVGRGTKRYYCTSIRFSFFPHAGFVVILPACLLGRTSAAHVVLVNFPLLVKDKLFATISKELPGLL
ncbi:hypothetical protein L6452_08157 [Arctium lappa]|uniref:Uncharacterized protein n=1 Tax=Arctium lappa TaxID=4217 RepID=A0ACB9DH51_ARCLA|nr:hypothetical protein L6452_08157 [Arctium lappa]